MSGEEHAAAMGSAPPRAGRWRPLWLVVLWLLLAEAGSLLVPICLGIAAGLGRWRMSPLAYALPATIALQAILLLGSWWQARFVGQGSRAAGLGWRPVRRPRLVAGFALLMVVWVLCYIAIIIHVRPVAVFISRDVPHTPVLTMEGGAALNVVRMLLIAVLAPVAEELFFRGWLWTALRRSWGALPTALWTGGIWLCLHALEGAVRVPILVPAAVLLSLARHYGGSVRASLPVHFANNAAAVAIQLIALLG